MNENSRVQELIVVKCSDSLRWYANSIGNKYAVLKILDTGEALVRPDSRYLNYVWPEDYQLINNTVEPRSYT